ncbi:hypothetical protein [Streptomyces sp. NPDC086838]|uniref:hypothetical protein n=1 Tax=Streptomyces sp. NPDC086838 TaxID=3365762 RepID=UPI0037F316E8
MGEQDTATKVSTWLGIAATVVGLLAFFGISNFNDLKTAPQSHKSSEASTNEADLDACETARLAAARYRTDRDAIGLSRASHSYAAELTRAAGQAETRKLANAMRTHTVSLEAYAQAEEDREASYDRRLALGTRQNADAREWKSLCYKATGDKAIWLAAPQETTSLRSL